jgi:deferrochelatase/peroxidase EfeB
MIYRAADTGEDEGQTNATVILRRSPSWGEASKDGPQVQAAILRDAAQARGSSRDNGEAVTRG